MLEEPVSLVIAVTAGAFGAVVSTITLKRADAEPVFPAASVAVALNV